MDRKEQIIQLIKSSESPISGTKIANLLGVSRQIIVQDVALLRASGINIFSTNKGYIITESLTRIFMVKHTNEQIEDELTTIIDLGGRVLDCSIKHDVYGEINVDLNINSRKEIKDFLNLRNQDQPLMQITNDIHFHTVEADSIDILDLIENELKLKGYLIKSS